MTSILTDLKSKSMSENEILPSNFNVQNVM